MASTYTTKQGDAWDAIAFQVYGDVKYTGFLSRAPRGARGLKSPL